MSELKDVANYINESGLPSAESMRADIEADDRNREFDPIYEKLDEYRALYERWTKGDQLSDEETKRMTDLSKELENLAGQS